MISSLRFQTTVNFAVFKHTGRNEKTYWGSTYAKISRYTPYLYAYVTLKSYLVLFDTQHWNVFQMFTHHNRVMGCFMDVVGYELSVT